MNNKKVVSSHVFMFPFKWDCINNSYSSFDTIDNRIDVEMFVDFLKKENKWKEIEREINNENEYNEFIYFYDNVRQAIYGREKYKKQTREMLFNTKFIDYILKRIKKSYQKPIVRCFRYDGIGDSAKYIIKTGEKEYSLDLKKILLKVFDIGIGCIVYFADNYDENYSKEDILKINDFGRRIYPQFLSIEACKNSFLATKLKLSLGSKIIDESFEYSYKEEPTRISDTIMKILGDNFSYSRDKISSKGIFLTPVIDDRMFVMSLYRDDFLSDNLMNDEHYSSEFWYKYVFIDNKEVTCQNYTMFKKLIENSTYLRSKKYGTFYGITRYSFVILKKFEDNDFIINHFKGMYFQMVLLALMQRAAILRFSGEASRMATLTEEKALKETTSLQKLYIEFVNNIYFREVTAQEQGIELYNMIIDKMCIEREVDRLDKEIEEIYSYANQITSGITNKMLNVITVVSIGIAMCDYMCSLFSNQISNEPINLVNMIKVIAIPWILFSLGIIGINRTKCSKFKESNNFYVILFLALIVISIFTIWWAVNNDVSQFFLGR